MEPLEEHVASGRVGPPPRLHVVFSALPGFRGGGYAEDYVACIQRMRTRTRTETYCFSRKRSVEPGIVEREDVDEID